MNKEENKAFNEFEYGVRDIIFGMINSLEQNLDAFCDCPCGDGHTHNHAKKCNSFLWLKDLREIEERYHLIRKEFGLKQENGK